MKIPSLPKGASGFPIVIVLVIVGAIYFWKKKNGKKGANEIIRIRDRKKSRKPKKKQEVKYDKKSGK